MRINAQNKCFLISVVAIGLLTSCSKNDTVSEAVGFCAIGAIANERCTHEVAGKSITLYSSAPSMPEETAIDLYADLPQRWVINRSYLSGESMYMGTMPVVWQQLDSGRWLAKVRIGACTDPDMVWRLTFEITTAEGQTTTVIHFPVAAHP